MTNVFKVFRTGVNSFFQAVGEGQAFRPTGDCTPSALTTTIATASAAEIEVDQPLRAMLDQF